MIEPEADQPEWVSLEGWTARHREFGCQRLLGTAQPTFEILGPGGRCRLTAASRMASLNGTVFYLGYAPATTNGSLLVHRVDLGRTLHPLLSHAEPPPLRNRTIVLDPGHGGDNPGARSADGGFLEKELTLDWALRAKVLLVRAGWEVVLTRTNDASLSLPDRVAVADAADAALFISLHFNSAGSRRDQQGIETFCLTPAGLPSTITRDYEDDPELTFPNNAHDRENMLQAMRLHRALVGAVGAQDRGVRRARFTGVLRTQNRPAVLLEGGYLSNPEEAERLADANHRERLAEAVASALGNPPQTLLTMTRTAASPP